MDVDALLKRIPQDYRKQSSRDLSVFASSVFGETYMITLKQLFGVDFPSIFWVIRKGSYLTFYRSEKAHQDFMQVVGEQLRDFEFCVQVADRLKELTDWFEAFIRRYSTIEEFNEHKIEFVDDYREFFAYHQVVYWGADYLINAYPHLKRSIQLLQDAYAYNERVVPDVEAYFRSLKVDHLRHNQDSGNFQEVGLFFFKDAPIEELHGADLDHVESYIQGLHQAPTHATTVKGLSVSQGKVTGEVQVIKNPNNLNTVRKGVILVTGMTRPQFNHILGGCKGIVAEEGNILSHAAILARESHIPCIVAAKGAMQAFKDGDIVELDAANGMVRLLD